MVSTRSTVQKLIPLDPELEQNLRRRCREPNLQWVPSLQETFLQSLFSGDLHNKEKMAFVIPKAGQPLGDSLIAHTTNIPSCITYPAVEEESTFEIKQHMLNILPTFHELSSDDPNMHIAEFLMGCKNILVRGFSAESIKLHLFPYTLKDQMHIFFRGLNMTTKTLVNTSCKGSYKDKNAQETCLLFEKMAVDTQQWAVEQPQSRSVFKMSNGFPYVTAQIEKMEKRFDAKFDMLLQRIPGSQVAVQQPLQAACNICNMITHDFMSCPHKDVCLDFTAEQVNAFNNFQRPRYDPYSNFYNPGWRDHPNLKWDKDQHSRPQFQQQVHQPAAPKAAWEVAIEKLANTTTQEIQNLQAAMKNMVKQMRQIALQVLERAPGTFPSQTEPNPSGGADCKAIRILRSGKSFDNRSEICVRNSQVASQPKTDSGIIEKSANLKDSDQPLNISEYGADIVVNRVYEPPMPYPERLGQGEIKPTSVILQLADHSVAYPKGIIEDLIIKVDNLYLLADFVILDMDEDMQTPIILGRPFMATVRTLIDVEAGTLTLRVQDQSVVFSLFEATKRPGDVQDCMRVDVLDSLLHAEIMPRLTSDPLLNVLHGFENKN
ncbi:unnamed protein product [Malus baccata var. baccata]